MTHNIEVESGKAVKLPTAGKYCNRDIVVSGTGSDAAELQAKYGEGKQAEYDAFWDVFQNYGEPTNYYYRFAYDCWTDENFNPKYALVCKASNTAGMALFYGNTKITDTKMPIGIQGSTAQAIFLNASSLVTVRKLTVRENVMFQNSFQGCTALKNITMGGTIGQDIDLHWSAKLTKASIESVMAALSTTSSGKSVSFSETAVSNAFTDEEWATLANTRSNWTINLV